MELADWDVLEGAIITCRKCPRLVEWREAVAHTRRRAFRDEIYWGKPVPGFGDRKARVLVVGLAPGAHGSNRTGRMFTGDASGEFLYAALHRAGFASQPASISRQDGLALDTLYITAVCRCVPPQNKPQPDEISACLPYLEHEMNLLPHLEGIVALGRVAFEQVLRIYRQSGNSFQKVVFIHGMVNRFPGGLPWLLTSYHPSRQNTQTGRLTTQMFDRVWEQVKLLIA